MTRTPQRVALTMVPAQARFAAAGDYQPRRFEPPRAGSMRASELPSRVGDQLIYPPRARAAAKAVK